MSWLFLSLDNSGGPINKSSSPPHLMQILGVVVVVKGQHSSQNETHDRWSTAADMMHIRERPSCGQRMECIIK